MAKDKILVLAAHPAMEQSRLNRRLLRAAAALQPTPGSTEGGIEVRDLYSLYPDYLIDAEAEQRALAEARLVVWLHPIHWYGMPPLMKLWLDSVLDFGWAYGPGGSALRGKDLWLVVTTGGDESSYRPDGFNRYFFDAFLPPYEQTATLCGMRFLAPLVLYGAHRQRAEEIEENAALFAQRLGSYPSWPELDLLPDCVDCEVPADARPVDPQSSAGRLPGFTAIRAEAG